jgi:hypothetical protein
MCRVVTFLWVVIGLAIYPMQVYCQAPVDSLHQILNLDSLKPDDQALLLQYQDSFKNDFYEFLDVFSKPGDKHVDTSVYDMDRSSHAEISLGLVSHELINGRIIALSTTKDKVISLYGVGFYPAVAYYHKYGFYFEVSTTFYTDYTIAHATPVPVISPSAGYAHTFFKRWFLGVNYMRTFNTYGSAESRMLLNNAMTFTSSIDIWKKIIVSSSFFVYWSSDHSASLPGDEKLSTELELSLKKVFTIYKFIGATEFSITPALNFYFANDNRTYVSALAVSDVKKDVKKDTIVRTQNVSDFFGFLDLEPSVDFDWRIRNFDIYFTPTLAVPFNIFYPAKKERVLNPRVYRFYAQVGIKYLFCIKRKHNNINRAISDSLSG